MSAARLLGQGRHRPTDRGRNSSPMLANAASSSVVGSGVVAVEVAESGYTVP